MNNLLKKTNIDFQKLETSIVNETNDILNRMRSNQKRLKSIERHVPSILEKSNITKKHYEQVMKYFKEYADDLNNMEQDMKSILSKSIETITELEENSFHRELLEKESKVLKKIAFSRENIIKWEKYTEEIIRELFDVFNFDIFFAAFETDNGEIQVFIFKMGKTNEYLDLQIKNYIKNTLRIKFNLKEDEQLAIIYEDILLVENRCINSLNMELFVRNQDFIMENPGVGGIIGIMLCLNSKLESKESEVLESLLSIMALVIGSSKALSIAIGELEYSAGHDLLTGLANRAKFEKVLNKRFLEYLKNGYKFSLIMIDLDDFKYINDKYGHSAGDIVLKNTANLLEQNVRDDDLISRLGGDEFCIILKQADINIGKIVANKILESFNKQKVHIEDDIYCSIKASIGVVEFPKHTASIENLHKVVDGAMYEAKLQGKNTVFVPNKRDIEQAVSKQVEKFFIIEKAIENDMLVPYFQEIKDLKTDTTFAYEVLARIELEDGTIMGANTFIEYAERNNKIKDIDKIIIKKALEYKKANNIKEKFFINISGKEIKNHTFIEYIIDKVKELNVNPSEIVIEITEREAIVDMVILESFLYKVQKIGFELAIDDFGSGYSSFYYLKYIDANYIKIDGEFIRELTLNKDKNGKKSKTDLAFVKSIKTLCDELEIPTLAEFVESEDIIQILKELGIDYGQGFHIGYPACKIEK
jgi:diguanylate cyclase (GGDEF)-like protein